jgi:hypothetical protein
MMKNEQDAAKLAARKAEFGKNTVKRFEFNGMPCVIQQVVFDMGTDAMRGLFEGMGMSNGMRGHLCGYVGVPEGNPYYGIRYGDTLSKPLKDFIPDDEVIGDRGIIPMFCAGGVDDGARLDTLLNVHGSLTFTEFCSWRGEGFWWLGFDCGHAGDDPYTCNDAFVENQCKQLIWEMEKYAPKMAGVTVAEKDAFCEPKDELEYEDEA